MAGSGVGGDGRSKEAMSMLALHEALRSVCLSSDWTYSVFWTIRPRPRCRGGNGCKVGDDNGNLMLMWEDGFCRPRVDDMEGEDLVRKAFSKMSIQLYNYGEGLMGKVASDKCHKWVFKEPSESEPNISNYWQSSFDALPPEWNDQFASGIQTIAVIQAGHGLLQLGSCKIIPEDLHFVLRMRHMFESLGYQSGFFLSQLFSSTRSSSPSPSTPPMKQLPTRPPPPLFNWSGHPSIASVVPPPMAPPPAYHHHPAPQMAAAAAAIPSSNKDDTQLFLVPPSSSGAQIDEMIPPPEHEPDLKWPNGLSFFTALTGRTDDAKLLFGTEMLGHKAPGIMMPANTTDQAKATDDASDSAAAAAAEGDDELLSSESQSSKARKMESSSSSSKFKRSFTLPARMSTSSSSSSLEHHHHQQSAAMPQQMDYRGAEAAGIYQDIMETFLD